MQWCCYKRMLRISINTSSQQRPGTDPSLETSEGAWLCQHLDFRLLASRTLREQISIVSSYPVCGNLLWKPRKQMHFWTWKSSSQGYWPFIQDFTFTDLGNPGHTLTGWKPEDLAHLPPLLPCESPILVYPFFAQSLRMVGSMLLLWGHIIYWARGTA